MTIDMALSRRMSRRTLLASGLAATGTGLAAPAWSRSSGFDFPDSRRLRALVEPSLEALGAAARVERLGLSGNGHPIDLISIGAGDRSALIVGAPHPNEPIGCLTIVTLIRRLARDPQFLERSGYSWHFIPAIDPDGLDLNAGWLRGPATLENYMRHFFRPAFANQPEYGFPIEMPDYRFEASTPENLCWQRALEIVRPTFQSSLHGADTGGAFFILSENRPELARALSRLPEQVGIRLNPVGEPDATTENYAPGVFSAFEVERYLADAMRTGEAPKDIWGAGRSSTEFAVQTYGSFCLICEVPLWEDRRQSSDRLSQFSQADVIRMQLDQIRENARLLDSAGSLLAEEAVDVESRALILALREAAALSPAQVKSREGQLAAANCTRSISLADVTDLEPGTTMMRTPAMLSRLARRHGKIDIARSASSVLAKYIDQYERSASLTPVPVEKSISLQIRSILGAIRYPAS